ncbi:unnamed protein product [Gordionus sp. m RMFG-2023]|uniref:melatonin receptor type 1C-like n=1 Tax=Gordionus sp. m RMFG-2023 TaxID=3053472 RepID=UPI0030E21CDD
MQNTSHINISNGPHHPHLAHSQIFSFYNYYWYMLFISLIGIIGNAGVVLAFKIDTNLFRNAGNLLVANLSLADLCICLLSGPLYLGAAYAFEFNYHNQVVVCHIMGGLNVLMFCESLYSIAFIGVIRLVLVTKNKATYNRWFSASMTYGWIGVSWALSILITILPALGQRVSNTIGHFGYHRGFRVCLWDDSIHTFDINWGSIISLFSMIPSIFVATFCYYKIFLIVRQSKSRARRNAIESKRVNINPIAIIKNSWSNVACNKVTAIHSNPILDHLNISQIDCHNIQSRQISSQTATDGINSMLKKHKFTRDHKTNIYLLIFFVAFTICWFPWNLIVLLERWLHFPIWFFRLSPVLGLTNSALNPFMYGMMNEKFRSPYIKFFAYFKSTFLRLDFIKRLAQYINK